MQIFKFLSTAIAVACISAFSLPAMASAPAEIVFESGSKATATSPVNDCLDSFDLTRSILLVEVETGCDPVLAEATGICLAPASVFSGHDIAAVFDPVEGVSCTSSRPSPPG